MVLYIPHVCDCCCLRCCLRCFSRYLSQGISHRYVMQVLCICCFVFPFFCFFLSHPQYYKFNQEYIVVLEFFRAGHHYRHACTMHHNDPSHHQSQVLQDDVANPIIVSCCSHVVCAVFVMCVCVYFSSHVFFFCLPFAVCCHAVDDGHTRTSCVAGIILSLFTYLFHIKAVVLCRCCACCAVLCMPPVRIPGTCS